MENDFKKLVKEMRTWQDKKEVAGRKGMTDQKRIAMVKSKELEKEVDRLLQEAEPDQAEQPKLF